MNTKYFLFYIFSINNQTIQILKTNDIFNFIFIKIQMTEKIKLGYWAIRGIAQIARLLLVYTSANWQDVKYHSDEEWYDKQKFTLGLQFPNLPYLIDGDFKLTESKAIYRYIINISNKKSLLGKNPYDIAYVDSLESLITDLRGLIVGLFYNKQWQKQKDENLQKARPKFQQLKKFIGQKDYALGYLTLIDFYLAQFSFFVQKISLQDYQKNPYFKKIRNNVQQLPQIKKYYQSQIAIKGPFASAGYASIPM